MQRPSKYITAKDVYAGVWKRGFQLLITHPYTHMWPGRSAWFAICPKLIIIQALQKLVQPQNNSDPLGRMDTPFERTNSTI